MSTNNLVDMSDKYLDMQLFSVDMQVIYANKLHVK